MLTAGLIALGCASLLISGWIIYEWGWHSGRKFCAETHEPEDYRPSLPPPIVRPRAVHRPDARHFKAQTTEELVFRLVESGDRLMEGEG